MKTYIYLHSIEQEQASWLIVQNDGKITQSGFHEKLSDLPQNARKNETIVVMPGDGILVTEAMLPKLSRHRLMQALPFALEELLIDDVSELHFAVGDQDADGKLPVLVVSQQTLEGWLSFFKQYDITPSQMIPAMFTLPVVENTWQVTGNSEICLARTGKFSGFISDKENLQSILDISLSQATDRPETIHYYNTCKIHLLPDAILVNEDRLTKDALVKMMLLNATKEPFVNLLQGRFQAKSKSSETKMLWQYAGYAAAAWLILAGISNITSFFILRHQVNTLNVGINAIYKKNFPQSSSVVAPRDRMTEKLQSLGNSAKNNPFLMLLAMTGKTLSQSSQIQLKSLDFRNNQLTLELTANRFDVLDSFTKKLSQQGLSVKQQNAAIKGTEVKATILIQRGNA